ncbi:MAG: hypothetical protein EXX96DRAFT_12375 [Benjaminiella poitrasii]|nr:MAG: hypothetical protein EXX96DRAFT_12375 [Benjaminiella poitrasii]
MELPQIGKHCQLSGCNSLDFLPIACPLCKHTFCGDHRLPLAHDCSQWSRINNQLTQCNVCQHLVKASESTNLSPEEALDKHKASKCSLFLYPPNESMKTVSQNCAVRGCHNIDPRIGPVHCNGCDQDFCLTHRYPSSHQCSLLHENEQKKIDKKLMAQEKLAKTFHQHKSAAAISTTAKVKKVKTNTKTGGMIELMKMKSQAKNVGASVPITSRIYLYVRKPNFKEPKNSLLPLYLDKKNTIGKSLDLIADICNVTNKNNTLPASHPERLELYKFPEMTILDKSDILENTLQNLDIIWLERQGNITIS